jgi:hypothetical protein
VTLPVRARLAGKARHPDRDQREQPAHRKAVAFACEEMLS